MNPQISKSIVTAALYKEFVAIGFVKRSQGFMTRDVGHEILGGVSFNCVSYRREDAVEVNVMVGVRHAELQKVVAKYKMTPYKDYEPMTFGEHLGYLMPEKSYLPYIFQGSASIEHRSRDVIIAFQRYGMPFMKANSTLEAICSYLENEHETKRLIAGPDPYSYHMAAAYALLGKKEAALAFLERKLAECAEGISLADQEFREFAARLSEHLVSGGITPS